MRTWPSKKMRRAMDGLRENEGEWHNLMVDGVKLMQESAAKLRGEDGEEELLAAAVDLIALIQKQTRDIRDVLDSIERG